MSQTEPLPILTLDREALQGVPPASILRRLHHVRIDEARRIVSHVFRGGKLGEPVATVRKVSVLAVAAAYHVPTLTVREVRRSALDPFVKFLFETHDHKLVEAVRIPLEKPGRYSVCLSSQVGCALGCTFCATGRMGLRRNLETWEIVEQVRLVRDSIARGEGRVHGIVFQGMGEAMANLDRVLGAISVITDPSALAIDQRTITVCTSGLPAGIRRLAKAAPKVRLAISIGSARPQVRACIMPISEAHSLHEVMEAAAFHARETGLSPMWALTLLGGVNDTDLDAHALGDLAKSFAEQTGHRPRVTFIAYNPIGPDSEPNAPELFTSKNAHIYSALNVLPESGDPFVRATPEREDAMRAILATYGVYPHRRYSGGADVDAACGQLAARNPATPAG